MVLQEIFEKVKCENARSLAKHGPWQKLSSLVHKEAIQEEFEEWLKAFYAGDIHGDHGEIAEAIQAINVLCRRIMYLTGEDSA